MREIPLNKAIEFLKRTIPGLEAIYLFGSGAKNELRTDSDIDIALLAFHAIDKLKLFEWASSLSQLLNREVDLIDLFSASTVFRFQIISTAIRLYAKNETRAAYFEMTSYSMYYRFQEERKNLLASIYARGKIYK